MRCRIASLIVVVALSVPSLQAAAVGMFAGQIVQGANNNPPGKWLFVKGRAGMMRRVEVSSTHVEYAPSVPQSDRSTRPADDLKDGALVQVAAQQGKAGEWVAQSILILRLTNRQALRTSIK